MDELERSIRRLAADLRAIEDELHRAGLIPPEAARLRWWELGRQIGTLYQRVHTLLLHHESVPIIAPRRTPQQGLASVPRPD